MELVSRIMKLMRSLMMIFIILILVNLKWAMTVYASDTLPILATKQDIYNIRFITIDGKYTYFQRSSGDLLLSSNFNITPVLKGKSLTQYSIYSSPSRKKLLITKSENFHRYLNVRQLTTIYAVDFGKSNVRLIGDGVVPKLHLGDTWMSYYDVQKRKLFFKSLVNQEVGFEIVLNNRNFFYFIPEVVMPDRRYVIYTDVNEKGEPSVLKFNVANKQFEVLETFSEFPYKVELCLKGNDLFVGLFSLSHTQPKTSILKVDFGDSFEFKTKKEIYATSKKDIGNIICSLPDKNIYFIKDVSDTAQIGSRYFEAVSLNVEGDKLSVLSNLKFATQIIELDGRLMAPYRGKNYLLNGDTNVMEDNFLKNE